LLSGNDNTDEDNEIEELKGLFVRETDISRAQFAKHLVLEENARQRDRVIAKKEECDRRREEEVRAYQAVVAQRVQKEREARDRAQAVRAAHSQSKIDETMALKERLIRQEELGRRREAKRLQQVQKRVVEARSLDDRLDESEEALQAAQRQMSVVEKKKLAAAEAKTRARVAREKKNSAAKVKQDLAAGAGVKEAELRAHRLQSAAEIKQAATEWKSEKGHFEREYVKRGETIKQDVHKVREKAREAKQREKEDNKAKGDIERANDYLVNETKDAILRKNRDLVSQVYRSRWATKEEEEQMRQLVLQRSKS